MIKKKYHQKNKVIFISIWRITDSKLRAINIKEYEDNYDIELHDLSEIINSKFAKTFNKEKIQSYKVFKFKSYLQWVKRLLFLKSSIKERKILVISEISVNGIKSFICTLSLILLNCLIIKMEQPGHVLPSFKEKNKKTILKKNRKNKFNLGEIFSKNLYYFSFISNTLITSYFFKKNMYVLTVPNRFESCSRIYPFSKIIKGSTNDFSNFLSEKKGSQKRIIDSKYALYIDGARPHIQGDEFLLKDKVKITPENWYPKLNKYFDLIENELKLKVIISGHPKTKKTGLEKRYGGRKVIYNKTKDLVKDCEFISTRISTAISYAVIYKKPIIFILSKELAQEKTFTENQNLYLQYFSQKPLFIDKRKELIIKQINNLKINKKIYKRFFNENLTGSEKTNYILINDIFQELIKNQRNNNRNF